MWDLATAVEVLWSTVGWLPGVPNSASKLGTEITARPRVTRVDFLLATITFETLPTATTAIARGWHRILRSLPTSPYN